MIQGGWQSVAIVASADTDFDDVVWLDNLGVDGYFTETELTAEEYNGTPYFLQTEYELLIEAHESPTKYTLLRAWSEANTSVMIWCFGIRGSVVWTQSTRIQLSREVSSTPGSHYVFRIATKKRGSALLIQNSINLLSPLNRTAEGATTDWTSSACTLTKTTPNGSFTTASGNIWKLTQSSGTLYYSALGVAIGDRIPARAGMSFTVRADAINTAGTGVASKLLILEYDKSDALQATNTVAGASGTGTPHVISGTVTLADADTAYIRMALAGETTSGATGVTEFDNIQITHGTITEAYYNG